MSSSSPHIPTELEVKAQWDAYSATWKAFEFNTLPTANTLLSCFRNMKENENVLEIACGSGAALALAARILHPSAKLWGLDISVPMLELTKKQIVGYESRITLVEGSALALPFKEEFFHRIYSNYCLHLVPDPDLMLREAHRVLVKDGMAVFSIWGRPENSPKFTIIPTVRKRIEQKWNLPTSPPVRSNFHLSNHEQLKKRFIESGFKNVLAWYSTEVTTAFTGEEYYLLTVKNSPSSRSYEEQLTKEQKEDFRSEVIAEAEKYLSQGIPISTEVLFILAFKA